MRFLPYLKIMICGLLPQRGVSTAGSGGAKMAVKRVTYFLVEV